MILSKSLTESLRDTPNVGVLVIDEYVGVPAYVAEAQARVLQFFGDRPTWAFTRHSTPLRHGLPLFDEVIVKPRANAFVRTGLYQKLTDAKVEHLVVMGYHRDACVSATIGHLWGSVRDPEDYGAVNLGFTVHTHLHLVHGGETSRKRDKPMWYASAMLPEVGDAHRLRVYRKM